MTDSYTPPTIDQRAAALQLRVYDTALPQDWVDNVVSTTGWNPVGHFVWCYDEVTFIGSPVPLDAQAAANLVRHIAESTRRACTPR